MKRGIQDDDAVERELVHLAAGDDRYARSLFDQPSEKLLGQLQAAGNVALDFPTVYPALYGFLTRGSDRVADEPDSERWRRFAHRMAEGVPADGPARASFEAESRESTQARARLGNLLSRKLDAFQTSAEYGWARMNQLVAVGGGALLLYLLLPNSTAGIPLWPRAALAVLGGLVAPFAKDVVSALSGLRAR